VATKISGRINPFFVARLIFCVSCAGEFGGSSIHQYKICTITNTGKPIPIKPSAADFLYPYVRIGGRTAFEANFGDNLAKPFKYDIGNCPGMDIIPIQN
jgi:hypothetical protein